MIDETVHLVLYASQPNLLIECDESVTSPSWKQERKIESVFTTIEGRYYTFDRDKVTCEKCKNR